MQSSLNFPKLSVKQTREIQKHSLQLDICMSTEKEQRLIMVRR